MQDVQGNSTFSHDLLRKENSDSLIAVSTSNGKLQKKEVLRVDSEFSEMSAIVC